MLFLTLSDTLFHVLFSSEFMSLSGNTRVMPPELDALALRSLVFTTLFATGTRTLRGLEA
jgi:hypothetical protein